MKKSINIWSFYENWSLPEKLRLARDAGFAGLEIDLSEAGPVNLKSTPADLKAVRVLAEKCGLQLSGLATVLYWGANAASADLATREKAARILQKQIECAAALGIDTILVVPGAVRNRPLPPCLGARQRVHQDRAASRGKSAGYAGHRKRLEQISSQPAGDEGVH